jgi:hypothetical protein
MNIDPKDVLKFGYVIVLFSMIYFFGITFIALPESGEDNAKYISGFLVGTGLASIIGYYWGGAIRKSAMGISEPKPGEKD